MIHLRKQSIITRYFKQFMHLLYTSFHADVL